MEENKQHEIIKFGKYKGQPVEVLQADPSYCKWLTNQEWFAQRYPSINTLIINNFAVPEDTPVHNALQALFLEKTNIINMCNCVFNVKRMNKALLTRSIKKCEQCKSEYNRKKENVLKRNAEMAAEKEENPEWFSYFGYEKELDPLDCDIMCDWDGAFLKWLLMLFGPKYHSYLKE